MPLCLRSSFPNVTHMSLPGSPGLQDFPPAGLLTSHPHPHPVPPSPSPRPPFLSSRMPRPATVHWFPLCPEFSSLSSFRGEFLLILLGLTFSNELSMAPVSNGTFLPWLLCTVNSLISSVPLITVSNCLLYHNCILPVILSPSSLSVFIIDSTSRGVLGTWTLPPPKISVAICR